MTLTRENIEDTSSSEEMLQVDLGRGISYIYDSLDEIDLDSENPGVLDPSFYREKLSQVRRALMIVQQLYSKAMRAKTSAQTRLTSRQTRYELLINASLENNEDVKMGQSAPERMARATNRLVDLSNAIRESKNEVEAISNAVKVLGTYNKSLTTISADIKQQARLVETELAIFKGKGGQGEPPLSSQAYKQRVAEIEDKYSATPMASEVVEDDDDIDKEAMSKAFASAETHTAIAAPLQWEGTTTTEESPSQEEETPDSEDPDAYMFEEEGSGGKEETPAVLEKDEEVSFSEEAFGSTGLDFAMPLEDDPNAPPPQIVEKNKTGSSSPSEKLPVTEKDAFEEVVEGDDTAEEYPEEDPDEVMTFLGDEDLPTLTGDGDLLPEEEGVQQELSLDLGDMGVVEPPSLPTIGMSTSEQVGASGSMPASTEDFSVVSSKETAPKVSSVFAGNEEAASSIEEGVLEETTNTPSIEEQSAPTEDSSTEQEKPPSIDDLLRDLGIE